MDVSYLIQNFSPVTTIDIKRKDRALRYAHSLLDTQQDFNLFLSGVQDAVKNSCFGGPADDFYFTALLAIICSSEPNLDSFLAAILNKITLQLEFQTRYLGRGAPELFVFDGDPKLFLTAMANVNTAVGLVIGAEHIEVPAWGVNHANIEFNPLHLHAATREKAAEMIPALGRPIGCLAITLSAMESFLVLNPSKQYAYLKPYITEYTTYLIEGPPAVVERAERNIREKYPDAQMIRRTYDHRVDGYISNRAVLLIESIFELPDVDFPTATTLPCQFIMAREAVGENFNVIDYRPSDYITPKRPAKIITTAPLTEENKNKMSQTREFFYSVVSIKNGLMIPVRNEVDSTYIHLSSEGEIALDAGNEHSRTMMMPIYKEGYEINATRHSKLHIREIAKISGSAMPIAFTPDVHQFFSHFVLQCLPRILILREIGRVDTKILVPNNIRKKQLAMLRLAGVAEEMLVRIPPNTPIQADELIVPRAWPLMFSPFTTQIYHEMLSRVIKQPRKPTRRTLITRESRRTWRNMVTYDAVRHTLVNDHGFIEIRPESLTIEEEIELFYETKILIGAEGAGLYSASYSQSESTVVSLCDEDYMMPILATLAEIQGFNICHVFGESFRSDRDVARRLPYGHADFSIDPCAVENMIDFVEQLG